MKNIFFITMMILVFSNCTNDNNNNNAPKQETVNEICNCTAPVVKINEEIKAIQMNGDIEAITALVEKAGLALEEAIKCTKKNASGKVDKEKLKKALIDNCKVEERMIEDLIKQL